ncbi:MAG: hypothetical protein EBR53_08865, partial [Actinobacteria bacterium]|nr:hypothetical protein [Actinomycetota bacterium]
FDLRTKFAPGKNSIIPHQRAVLPPNPVRMLVTEMAKVLEVYDAERRVSPTIRTVSSALDGQALAADFIDALARRLPILVETVTDKTVDSSHTGPLLADLIGIAHIAHITSDDALEAFNAYCKGKILNKNYVTILWPHPAPPITFHTVSPTREQIELPIVEAAALQPEIPTQAPPRFSVSRTIQHAPVVQTSQPAAPAQSVELAQTIERLQRTVDEHQSHIEQLDDALEEAEAEREGQTHVKCYKISKHWTTQLQTGDAKFFQLLDFSRICVTMQGLISLHEFPKILTIVTVIGTQPCTKIVRFT